MLDPNKGYKKQIKSYVGKTGKPVKTGKSEFEEFISKDPEFITKSLLGVDATIKDTNSFETVWKAIHKPGFPWKKYLSEIITYYADLLQKKGLPLPKELGVKESSNRMKKFSEISNMTLNEDGYAEGAIKQALELLKGSEGNYRDKKIIKLLKQALKDLR